LIKSIILTIVVLVLGFPVRVAFIVGLGLAQIGEFSFVIASLGHDQGLLSPSHYQTFLAAAVITLCATPFLVILAPHVAAYLGRFVPTRRRDAAEKGTASADLSGHVIIVGHGVNGRNLARVMNAVGVPYRALDLDGRVVRRARLAGEENIIYGDATRPEILEGCGIREASVVVFAIADPDATRRGVRLVRSMNPNATIIVRTLLVDQVEGLRKLGADEVIPEEFETSIAMFSRVLRRLHTPANVIRNQERLLRSEGYEFLRAGDRSASRLIDRVSSLMAAGTTETFLVAPGSPADGRTIRETELRQKTGATIIAVVRDGKASVSPPPDTRIEKDDVLVLVGSHAALERAFEALGGSASAGAPA
jgi:CPA2 family monovalent cation:H+ antiporter-2